MFRLSLLKNLSANYDYLGRCFPRYKSIASKTNSKIVWIDLEMTGLSVENDRIMEIACIITDKHLNILAEHPALVINQPDSLLDTMTEWCTTTHTQTGLLDECKKSTTSEAQAEESVLNFLTANGVEALHSPLAGNSIYMDRMFLRQYMPRVDQHLNYRLIDVSSVKELCKRWDSSLFAKIPKKKSTHRGTDDIKESIEEAKFYKEFLFERSKKAASSANKA